MGKVAKKSHNAHTPLSYSIFLFLHALAEHGYLRSLERIYRDTCVIGAGPAGAIAALHLAKAGIKTILIEAQDMPRPKACADIITSQAIREIKKIAPDVMGHMEQDLRPIWGTDLHVQNQGSIEVPFKALDDTSEPSCYAIDRSAMDLALWHEVQKRKVKTLANTRVIGHERDDDRHVLDLHDGRTVVSKVCIVATGATAPGFLREIRNPKVSDRHSALGVRAYYKGLTDMPTDRCQLYLMKKWMPGGFYIAPLADGRYNVNMVVRADKVKRSGMHLRRELEGAISQHPSLKRIFKNAELVSDVKGSPLPLATVKRLYSADGMILTGDTAGLIDLISANGIPQAMISGRLAAGCAEAILNHTDESKAIKTYQAELEAAIVNEVKLGKKLSPILGIGWVSGAILGGLGMLAKSESTDADNLERILYASDPWKELLRQVNPLSSSRS